MNDAIIAEQILKTGAAVTEDGDVIKTYIVRASETRVHKFRVEACSEQEAMDMIANGEQEFNESFEDGYDSMEVMDASLESEL